jgi:hypothetical protein
VVLDEAHTIRNRNTGVFRACAALRARCRWCLTATPLVNTADDAQVCAPRRLFWTVTAEAMAASVVADRNGKCVRRMYVARVWCASLSASSARAQPLFAFLRAEPLDTWRVWEDSVGRPVRAGDSAGLTRLRVALRAVTLRRNASALATSLPPKTVRTAPPSAPGGGGTVAALSAIRQSVGIKPWRNWFGKASPMKERGVEKRAPLRK